MSFEERKQNGVETARTRLDEALQAGTMDQKRAKLEEARDALERYIRTPEGETQQPETANYYEIVDLLDGLDDTPAADIERAIRLLISDMDYELSEEGVIAWTGGRRTKRRRGKTIRRRKPKTRSRKTRARKH